jgi:hypothetical protein
VVDKNKVFEGKKKSRETLKLTIQNNDKTTDFFSTRTLSTVVWVSTPMTTYMEHRQDLCKITAGKSKSEKNNSYLYCIANFW